MFIIKVIILTVTLGEIVLDSPTGDKEAKKKLLNHVKSLNHIPQFHTIYTGLFLFDFQFSTSLSLNWK